jgi:hypothetical protein
LPRDADDAIRRRQIPQSRRMPPGCGDKTTRFDVTTAFAAASDVALIQTPATRYQPPITVAAYGRHCLLLDE